MVYWKKGMGKKILLLGKINKFYAFTFGKNRWKNDFLYDDSLSSFVFALISPSYRFSLYWQRDCCPFYNFGIGRYGINLLYRSYDPSRPWGNNFLIINFLFLTHHWTTSAITHIIDTTSGLIYPLAGFIRFLDQGEFWLLDLGAVEVVGGFGRGGLDLWYGFDLVEVFGALRGNFGMGVGDYLSCSGKVSWGFGGFDSKRVLLG